MAPLRIADVFGCSAMAILRWTFADMGLSPNECLVKLLLAIRQVLDLHRTARNLGIDVEPERSDRGAMVGSLSSA